MGFGEAFTHNLTKPFEGRASRSEYWWFFLWYIILTVVPYIVILGSFGIAGVAGMGMPEIADPTAARMMQGFAFVLIPFAVVWYFLIFWVALASICASIRRLHDRDKSGWWFFVLMIPIVGWILGLVWFCQRGTQGANRFGPDPLSGTSHEVFS